MRKLASVQRIINIRPIPDSDNIEVATVNGWDVVVKKNEFKINDLVIYFEIDSFLPIKPEYEFLRKSSYKKLIDGTEGFRLKTIRLRKQLSQGLIIPLSTLTDTNELIEGDNLTDILEITKYEPPIPAELSGKVKGNFPSFIPKTDEERIQNLASTYDQLCDNTYYVTEKLDGSSATYYLNDNVFGVCSRNLDLLETEGNTFWKIARELDIENKLKTIGYNVAIQGELIGEGIQGNPYKIKGHSIRIFNLYNIDTQSYVDFNTFIKTMNILQILTVPVIETRFKLPKTISDLISKADGMSILNPTTRREGLVIRSSDRSISFKAISNDFLEHEK